MKFRVVIHLLLSSFLILSCKKEIKDKTNDKTIFVSFKVESRKMDLVFPNAKMMYSNLSTSWGLASFSKPEFGFSFYFPYKTEPGIYNLIPSEDPIAEMIYTDSLGSEFIFRKGRLVLSESDSAGYRFSGNFDGTFYNTNTYDSIEVIEGSFHFHRVF